MSSKQHRFDSMVGALTGDLYRYAFWLCRDPSLAEDLVQETLLRAWRFLDNLRDAKAVKAWLITTLRREHARLYERKRLPMADVEVLDVADSLSDNTEHNLEVAELHRRILALSPDYREPLAMQVVLGYSVAEISDTMELSQSAVMTRLFRARKQLLDAVEADSQRQRRGGAP